MPVIRSPRTLLCGFLLLCGVPAIADVKDGVDAWSRGDYPAAIKQWQSARRQGRSRCAVQSCAGLQAGTRRLAGSDQGRNPVRQRRRAGPSPGCGQSRAVDVPARRTGPRHALYQGCIGTRRSARALCAGAGAFQRRWRRQRLGARLRTGQPRPAGWPAAGNRSAHANGPVHPARPAAALASRSPRRSRAMRSRLGARRSLLPISMPTAGHPGAPA